MRGGEENAVVQRGAEFKIGLGRSVVDGVALCAHLLFVIGPVPGLQFLARVIFFKRGLQLGGFFFHILDGDRSQRVQEFTDRGGRLSGALICHQGSVIWVAEQFGTLRAQERNLRHYLAGIVLATVGAARDRKSTRLNSSHVAISYAVFCLKKKNT